MSSYLHESSSGTRGADRPRIALVTSLWPVAGAPYAGKPIYETALRLQQRAELRVFCPCSRYPRLLGPRNWVYHRPVAGSAPPDVATEYLEYWTLPVAGRGWNGLGTQFVLGPALRRWRPDLILSYWLYPACWAAVRIARALGVPVVVGARGSDLHRIPDRLVRHFTGWTLRHADAVLTVTNELRDRAVELGAAPAHTHAIPNGCDTSAFHPGPRDAARRALGLDAAGPLLVQVGHLIPSKGVLDLWTAFAALARKAPDARLALIGAGPVESQLRQMAARDGLSGRLILPGARPSAEVALWMQACDVACLASHNEGCPNTVLEALASGRPVVGCRVGGIAELVRPGLGLLVPAAQPDRLAEALERALATRWDEDRIRRGAARSWDDVARETMDICQALLI